MELAIVKNNGRWLEGSKMPGVFKQLVQLGLEELRSLLSGPYALPEVVAKTKHMEVKNLTDPGHNRGEVIVLQYELGQQVREFEVYGRDTHGAGTTWILEVATPPCQTIEELEWWCHALFRAARVAIDQVPGVTLISTAINPMEKFSVGISFGDHHHIGIPDERARRAAYNMIRAFVPQLIAISVNSPFSEGRLPEISLTPKGHIQMTSMIDPFSVRLHENIQQLGPKDESHYIPHLAEGQGIDRFQQATNKASAYDSRFVDVFPFTRFGTIEVRFFDAQLSIADRLAQALVLQCLAQKGIQMLGEGKDTPVVGQKHIVKNRDNAILKGGLIGLSRDKDLGVREPAFAEVYQGLLADGGKRVQYLYESTQNMVYFIRDELDRLGVLETRYLDPVLCVLWGGREGRLTNPISPAQLQMFVVRSRSSDLAELVRYLDQVSESVAANPSYCPLVEELGSPVVPSFLQPVTVEVDLSVPPMVIAGESVSVGISLSNAGASVRDLLVRTLVQDDGSNEVARWVQALGTFEGGTRRSFDVAVQTSRDVGIYRLFVEVYRGSDRLLYETRGLRTHRFMVTVSHAGPDVYLDLTPADSIPFTAEIGNGFPSEVRGTVHLELEEIGSGEVLGKLKVPASFPGTSKTILAPSAGLGELATAILRGQDYVETKPLRPMELRRAKRSRIVMTVVSEAGKVLGKGHSSVFLLRSLRARVPVASVDFVGGLTGESYFEGDEIHVSIETLLEEGAPPMEAELVVSCSRFEHHVGAIPIEDGRVTHDLAFGLPSKYFNPRIGDVFLSARTTEGNLLTKARLPLVPRPQLKVDLGSVREDAPGRLGGHVLLRSRSDVEGLCLKLSINPVGTAEGEGDVSTGTPLEEAEIGPVDLSAGKAEKVPISLECGTERLLGREDVVKELVLTVEVTYLGRVLRRAQARVSISSPESIARELLSARSSIALSEDGGVALRCSVLSRRRLSGVDAYLVLPGGEERIVAEGLAVGSAPTNLEVSLTWEELLPVEDGDEGPQLELRHGGIPVLQESLEKLVIAFIEGVTKGLRLGLVSHPNIRRSGRVTLEEGGAVEVRPVLKRTSLGRPFPPLRVVARVEKGGVALESWESGVEEGTARVLEAPFRWVPEEGDEGAFRLVVDVYMGPLAVLSRDFEFTLSRVDE